MSEDQIPPSNDAAYEAFAAQFRAYSEALNRGDTSVPPPVLQPAPAPEPPPQPPPQGNETPYETFARSYRERMNRYRESAYPWGK